ncbi:FAD/NAD(P)-binding domain-containing protein [Penicillium cataractarum]|uniref:FAD/NAD(P)-binding domain-containing protein n=1 Tax=Penicillium cataractarum TaxID=2100454 RepID=A0A9W9RQN1_9EURO|nr:FAD/NAD(P)-binding domain-containing protein [Penicillium cataractarum]KAJ5363870.1 FAD/NAD(P)-binding domain-containing protein [Penicillium cataractarum]
MLDTHEAKRLHILIAGAGIGGLSAAIALRQAGHVVDVFESSRFAVELGAAIHLPPNVNGLLRRLGIQPDDFRCNDAEFVSVFDSQGNVVSSKDVRNLREIYPFPWQLSHRIDLHEALKAKATSLHGPGVPVTIHLRCKVVGCDPAHASLTLSDGTVVQGDLLIGADGVHSVLRKVIAQEDIAAEPSGGSAFRFLIPISKVKENPETAALVQKAGELQFWDGQYRRLVIYPCRNNTELNFVCLHPDTESEGTTEGWNIAGSQENLLRVFDEFSPAMKALLEMADPESIKLWRLLDRKALGTWINGKSCLIGDAAHPFLPHQGQGGAQAIEDGVALGALFPLGTSRDEIADRLELYMKCRYERATMVQNFSRQAAFKISAKDAVGGTSTDPLEFMRINFGHDAHDFATNMLRKHLASRITNPDALCSVFGPSNPLILGAPDSQAILGSPSQRLLEIEFRARRNYLETFLPRMDSRIASPGGWSKASWAVRRIQPAEWKGHGEITVVGLCIFNSILSPDQTEPKEFNPVIFCDNAEFVIAAREELNLPILLVDLKERFIGAQYQMKLERSGHTFMEIHADLAANHQNGESGTDLGGKSWVSLTLLKPDVVEALLPGLANVIGRLQGLDMKDPVIARSKLTV